MASHTVTSAKTFSLTGTGTQDTVTLGPGWPYVQVLNHSTTTTEKVGFSVDGTAVAAFGDDNTEAVLASESLTVRAPNEHVAVVVKLRPAAGTPMVTVRGVR